MTSVPATVQVTFTPEPHTDPPKTDPCPTCGHPGSAHDATSVRWCSATRLGVGRRDCICSGDVAEARTLSHY